jgi:nucleotide-binding universal stress UspA family protein
MAITTLVTVHSADGPIDALKPVISFAGEIGAHLDIIVLGIMKTMPTSFYGGVPKYYLTDMHDALLDEVKRRAGEVELLVKEAELPASVLVDYLEARLVARRMSTHALYADLAVFPHGSVANGDATVDAFTGILFQSGTPVLILGKSGSNQLPFRRAVLAWDFEPPAAKAIRQGLPLLSQAQDVRVVLVDPVRNPARPNPGDDIATFLARHGLPVTVDLLPSAGKEIAEVLLQHAIDKDADLIVMGGYGHSRLQEWLLGGTTRDMLLNSQITVLMTH